MEEENIKTIKEGKALILTKYKDTNKQGQEVMSEVFYNPLQVFNRDFTISMIHQYTKNTKEYRKDHFDGITIVDALSASGLRTIRFLKELKDIKKVYANDISEASHKLMMDNFKLNNLDLSKIEMTKKDANQLMYEYMYKSQNDYDLRFDVIDLDPYGSAVPFLDSAIQSAKSGSMICLTCTDSKVLNGPDTQKCFYQYGVSRGRNIQAYQEFALRTVLQSAKTIANKYQKSIEPLFSYMQKEFYCRIFIKINVSKSECAKTFVNTGNVYHCEQCSNFHVHSYGKEKLQKNKKDQNFAFVNINKLDLPSANCNVCGGQYDVMGPIYLGEIHNFEFVQQLLDTLQLPECDLDLAQKKKIIGLLQSVLNEKEDFPDKQVPILGISPKRVGKLIRAQQPSVKQLQSAYQSLGYKFIPTFTNPEVFKSDAPNHLLFDIIHKFKLGLVKEEGLFKNLEEGSIGHNILKRQIDINPDFDQKIESKKNKMFFLNPKKQGPLPKATINQVIDDKNQQEKEENIDQNKEQDDKNNGDIIQKKVKK